MSLWATTWYELWFGNAFLDLSRSWTPAIISFLLHDLIVITTIPVLLLRRKEPTSTLAWIFAILLMPFFGAIFFLIFGNDRLRRKQRAREESRKKLHRILPKFVQNLVSPIDVRGQLQLYRLLDGTVATNPVAGNDIEIYANIHRNYDDQIQAINEASHHVHIEYYIVEPDSVGWRYHEAMIAAAKRGCQVRFLYDAIGTRKLGGRFLGELHQAGVETASFIPVNLLTRNWIFNFRNHRKIVVCDGNVGFTGGANLGEEYVSQSEVGWWRDTHLRVRGPIVLQLQRVFAEDWAFATHQHLTDPVLFPDLEPQGKVVTQVVPGGPDTEVPVYHELYFSAVANAVDRIRIVTPFFVPSEAITVALQTAARRGVDVVVLVPKKSTKLLVRLAACSYYEELLEAGVRIFEYERGFVHSKVMTVDRRWSIIGTANFDNRSMKLNFEVGVAMWDSEVTRQADELFDEDLRESTEVTLEQWRTRPITRQIAENFARLFSAIL
ncbi:putative cardiolipin synthase YwiE [Planctomycetes bacterium Pan216]|uniref:Cardiolipin synthase n=1 Tax=Kolteria novifilia TaxID=2527975 RepID=A0A518AY39_9BACT|nr:putative cardiolipin synthase YwiE [Planctomycetes bacterium Pan216]